MIEICFDWEENLFQGIFNYGSLVSLAIDRPISIFA